jgi:hypothetical protein
MITDQLWGGTLVDLRLDVVRQAAILEIDVAHGDRTQRYELLLAGISEFRLFNGIEGPWEYAEVTEVHFELDSSAKGWAFEVVLWSEEAGLSGKCSAAILDGAQLEEGT